MYLMFLAVGFAAGMLVSQVVFSRRLEQRLAQPSQQSMVIDAPPVAVNVNVSEELVARYLSTFNLVAIPRDILKGLEEFRQTRH